MALSPPIQLYNDTTFDSAINASILFGLSIFSESQTLAILNQNKNETGCGVDGSCDYGMESAVKISLLTLYIVSLILAVGGNVTIVYIILKLLSRSTTKIFICSLCFCDIVLFLVCVPFTVVSDLIYLYWPFWSYLCPIVMFLQVATVLQRAFTLVALTLDKHYVAWKPLGRRLNHKSARLVIVFVWILSWVIAAPYGINSKIVYMPYEPGSMGLCTEEWSNNSTRTRYSYAILTIQYLLPVLVMACSYSHIAYIIWAKKPPGEKNQNRDRRLAKVKRKAVKMLMVVVIAYAVCWLPLHILILTGEQDPSIFNVQLVHYLWILSHWLAMSNSAVNPVVYYWMNPAYRAGFRIMLSSCRRRTKMTRKDFTKTVSYMLRSNKILLYLKYNRSDQTSIRCGSFLQRSDGLHSTPRSNSSNHSSKDECEIRVFAGPQRMLINNTCSGGNGYFQSNI